jgi:hypothetical protein
MLALDEVFLTFFVLKLGLESEKHVVVKGFDIC